jgi:hypothetical protein
MREPLGRTIFDRNSHGNCSRPQSSFTRIPCRMTQPSPAQLFLCFASLLSNAGVPGLAAQTSAVTEWRLAFAVDSAGRPIGGEKDTLLTAVRAGQPVRVGWSIAWRASNGATGRLEHVAEAAFLTIHHGEVFAQIPPILGQTPSSQGPVITLRPEVGRLWYALLDTTGRLSGYFTGDSTTTTTRVATYWYVQNPSVRPSPRPN